MKSILIPIEESPSLDAQLESAALLAGIFNAHIDGTAPSWVMGLAPFDGALDTIPTIGETGAFSAEAQQARIDAAERSFRAFIERRGIAWETPTAPTDHVTASWLPPSGSGDRMTAEIARLYDVTVLGRRIEKSLTPRAELLEAVLFESGRPILVTPPETPTRLGEVVVIAWNGSTESARLIAFAKPLLARARRVVVLTIEGGMVSGPSAGDVERALRRDGLAVEAIVMRPNGKSTGEAVLKGAADLGADLLLKGAYTHSRLRQLIFGGVTRHILQEATIPVLMSH
jgi:nucleotide-binding universal stress UspA family protein